MNNIIPLSLFIAFICIGLSNSVFAQIAGHTTSNISRESLRLVEFSSLTYSETQAIPPTDSVDRKITLQEAVNIAVKNNYRIKKGKNNMTLAKKKIGGAIANFMPTISGSLRGTRRVGQQFNQITTEFSNITSNNIRGVLSAKLTIFQGFKNIINLRRSHVNKRFQKVSNRRTRETVIFNAVSGFLQVILNQQFVKIDQQNLKSAIDQLKQIKAQVKVGTHPKVDLYNQQSIVASDRVALIQQKNKIALSKTKLVTTLQLDPKKQYHFMAPNIDDFTAVPVDLNLSQLIDKALTNRPDLEAQKLQIQLNRKSLALQRANYYPTLTLNAGITTRYNDLFRSPKTRKHVGFSKQFFDLNINKFIGFSLNVPIFNHLNTRLSVQQAKITYQNSKLDYHNLRYMIMQEVRQAYNDYKSYATQLKSTKLALKAAKKTYQKQKARYNIGGGTLVEVSDAKSKYVKARSNRIQNVLRYIFQTKLLNYYLGTIKKHVSLIQR